MDHNGMHHDHMVMEKESGHQHKEMKDKGGRAEHGGYSKHAGHSINEFKKKFLISSIITIPILALSPAIQEFLHISINFRGSIYLLLILSSFVFFFGGLPFLRGSVNELKHKLPGMMTLISLAIIVAYVYSSSVVFGLKGEIFFWELATLIDIMLLGHWVEMKSVMGASNALEKLSELIPDKAHILENGIEKEISTKDLRNGDVLVVKPGEKIPADGVVAGGESFVNESMVTGESKPVKKNSGSKVVGGSINSDGALRIQVASVGESSYLSKVINLVKTAQNSKSRTQVLADKAALVLTVVAVLASISTFTVWIISTGNVAFAIERAATVLIIACPHALGLAVPLVVSISTTASARNGLLIKNRIAFENSRKITAVTFDKTGTLTEGVFAVSNVYNYSKFSNDELVSIFAALEQNSEHPIGNAVINYKKPGKYAAKNFKAIKGKGVQGEIDGKTYLVCSPGYLIELGINAPEEVTKIYGTNIFLVDREAKTVLGALNLSDKIRKNSYEAVKILKKANKKIWMLTGDNKTVAESVSKELSLDGFFAEVLPENKQEKISELQSKGEFVAMVGDGINDAPALAKADVGIAVGSGTDIAAETADIILVNSNPEDVASLFVFGKATYNKMIQNLFWATGYNVIAIPLAAGVLYKYNIMLSPALGAVFMSLSTVVVAINAKTLRFGNYG